MATANQTPSMTDLLSSDSIAPADFVATVADYSSTGSAIANGQTISEALRRNAAKFEPEQMSAILKHSVSGAVDFLLRRFPEDAADWARLAAEAADLASRSDDTKYIAQAEIPRSELESAIALAGQVAISFYPMTGDSDTQALKTGHLLSTAQSRIHPHGNPLDTSTGKEGGIFYR